jgi:hypothetical protein
MRGAFRWASFIDGEDRMQQALLPHSLEDYVGEEKEVSEPGLYVRDYAMPAC